MSFKDLLVHVGGSAYERRVRLAAQVARTFGAHVVGVHVTTPPQVPAYIEAQLTAEVIESQARFADEDRKKAEAAFHDAMRAAGLSSVEWRAASGEALEVLKLHGRHADLAIVGQTEADTYWSDSLDVAGRLALSLGRPVLAVPYAGKFDGVGKRVLVAWDGGRAAARVLGDAMPFLQAAEEVSVLTVDPEPRHASMAGVDISAHLARHGVKAVAQHAQSGDMDAGALLLSRAADFGADLIVMGAYGHARWRELVLGGVTEHMLEHMTVPVLMSH